MRNTYKDREWYAVRDVSKNRIQIEKLGSCIKILFLVCFEFHAGTNETDFDLIIADEPTGKLLEGEICGISLMPCKSKKVIVLTDQNNEMIDFDCNYIVV